MDSPKYFIAVFGPPEQPGKDRVVSGFYHPDPKYAPFRIRAGDVILTYCTAGYERYSMQAPGIGVVLRVDHDSLDYRFFPFRDPISKERIDYALQATGELEKFKNIRFSSHWLFEISNKSFIAAIGTHEISWI